MDDQAEVAELPIRAPDHGNARRWMRLPLVCLLLAGCSYLLLDRVVGTQFSQHRVRGEFSNLLSAAEHFGTPYGQFLILMMVFAAHRGRVPRVFRIFAGAAVAGLSADVVKLVIARIRPREFDFATHSLVQGFTGLFPLGAGGAAEQSFPSAHTASAFGFAALLAWTYPGGRLAFIAMASLAGMQRIGAGAHFPSDVFLGAALGWVVSSAFVHWPPLAGRFENFERNWLAASEGKSTPSQINSESSPEWKQSA